MTVLYTKANSVPEQLNPSPSVNGSLHVHVKFGLSNPSLVQLAFVSHGSDRQGSGTVEHDINNYGLYGRYIWGKWPRRAYRSCNRL